jgi:hypothetical protein
MRSLSSPLIHSLFASNTFLTMFASFSQLVLIQDAGKLILDSYEDFANRARLFTDVGTHSLLFDFFLSLSLFFFSVPFSFFA